MGPPAGAARFAWNRQRAPLLRCARSEHPRQVAPERRSGRKEAPASVGLILRRAGSAARRRCRLFSRWSPRRCPPNRTCESPRIRLSMSTSGGCPLVQLALDVKYPLLRHLDAGQRRASIHRRPPSIQLCWVLTGPLGPVDGFPALPGGALLPRLLRVLRHAPTATADGEPAPDPAGVRRAPPGRFPRSLIRPVGRVGAQLYPGDIAARYRNPPRGLARPSRKRADETVLNSNKDRASRQPIAASFGAGDAYRGFYHWFGFPTPFCLASGPGPLAADRSYIVEGCSRPPPHLRHQAALQLLPAVTAAGGEVFHPTRSYGASWRSPARVEKRQSRSALLLVVQGDKPA